MEKAFSITSPFTNCKSNFNQEHLQYLIILLRNQHDKLADEICAGLLWSVTGDSDDLLEDE